MAAVPGKQGFPLAPLPAWAWAGPVAVWVVLLLVAFFGGSHAQSPYNPVPWWLVVVFGTALFPAALVSMMAHRDVSIAGDRLVVAGALLFARKVPVADLDLDQARILDLGEHTEFRPLLKFGGFALPGFKVGHFLLRNRRRAFCLMTSADRTLLLPQRDGKLLLLSPDQPQALLDALRRLARDTPSLP